jgi:hypothetical protein
MVAASHITVSPADRARVFGSIQIMIRKLRKLKDSGMGVEPIALLLADILEQVVVYQVSGLGQVCQRLSCSPTDELFIEMWDSAAIEIRCELAYPTSTKGA